MTTLMQTLCGLAMIAVGGLKTWLHMGSISVLSFPTCAGKTATLQMSQTGWLEQTHCWGCYMLAVGLVIFGISASCAYKQRRSVAVGMD